jgi:hypothetical protein
MPLTCTQFPPTGRWPVRLPGLRAVAVGLAAAGAVPPSAYAINIDFAGTITDSCTLVLNANGLLQPSSDGKSLSSEFVGAQAAALLATVVGSAATVSFGAPSLLVSPVGYLATPVVQSRHSSLLAGTSNWSSTASSVLVGLPGSLFTIDARLTDAAGLPGGIYTVRTVVTCAQGN